MAPPRHGPHRVAPESQEGTQGRRVPPEPEARREVDEGRGRRHPQRALRPDRRQDQGASGTSSGSRATSRSTSVHLGGAGKARKVELKVTVDGQEGAALGVMSQGELHSLALSLFIPRATLAESPFRFVVIDDPVQSMDPARVDGLANVLQAASKDRQVVVFTHDDRLPEAVRRLGIKATVIEVTRKEGSLVAHATLEGPRLALHRRCDHPGHRRGTCPLKSRDASSPASAARPSRPPAWKRSAADGIGRGERARRRRGSARRRRHQGPRRPRPLRRHGARRRGPHAPQEGEQGRPPTPSAPSTKAATRLSRARRSTSCTQLPRSWRAGCRRSS